MPKFQAVLFDLDDTLYPEREYVLSGFRAVAEWAEGRLNIPKAQGLKELTGLFAAGQRGHIFDIWLDGHGKKQEETIRTLVQVYREHTPILMPYPETVEVLGNLRRKYRLGLISDGYLAVQQRKLAALGLAHCFDAIVFSDMWGREAWKPSTVPFTEALAQLNVSAEEAIYVGDNPKKDFLGARQVGMFTVQVHRPEGEYGHCEPPTNAHAPHQAIPSLFELENIINHNLPTFQPSNVPTFQPPNV